MKTKRQDLVLDAVNRGKLVPMTGAYLASMDRIYGPVVGWGKAALHSRRRGFATAAVRCGVHMGGDTYHEAGTIRWGAHMSAPHLSWNVHRLSNRTKNVVKLIHQMWAYEKGGHVNGSFV